MVYFKNHHSCAQFCWWPSRQLPTMYTFIRSILRIQVSHQWVCFLLNQVKHQPAMPQCVWLCFDCLTHPVRCHFPLALYAVSDKVSDQHRLKFFHSYDSPMCHLLRDRPPFVWYLRCAAITWNIIVSYVTWGFYEISIIQKSNTKTLF